MKQSFLAGILLVLCAFAQGQECREPNPAEKALIERLANIFDAEVLSKCNGAGWQATTDNPDMKFSVANTRPNPERPLFLCSGERRLKLMLQKQAGDAQLTTQINSAIFKLSFPGGGERATTANRITLPGAPLAYLLTLHTVDGDKHRVVVGLGKWTDIAAGSYKLTGNVFINYHFQHRFPTTVIENLYFEITGKTKEDVQQIASGIDWKKISAILN